MLVVELMKRTAGGQVSDLGIVVDTTADTGVREGWKLDIAATKSGVIHYTTPEIVAVPNGGTGGGGGTGTPAKSSVRKLGG